MWNVIINIERRTGGDKVDLEKVTIICSLILSISYSFQAITGGLKNLHDMKKDNKKGRSSAKKKRPKK